MQRLSDADFARRTVEMYAHGNTRVKLYDTLNWYRMDDNWTIAVCNAQFNEVAVRRLIEDCKNEVTRKYEVKETRGLLWTSENPVEWEPEEEYIKLLQGSVHYGVVWRTKGQHKLRFDAYSGVHDFTLFKRKKEHEGLDFFDMMWENVWIKEELDHTRRKRDYCIVRQVDRFRGVGYYLVPIALFDKAYVNTITYDQSGEVDHRYTWTLPVKIGKDEHQWKVRYQTIENSRECVLMEMMLEKGYQRMIRRRKTDNRDREEKDAESQTSDQGESDPDETLHSMLSHARDQINYMQGYCDASME